MKEEDFSRSLISWEFWLAKEEAELLAQLHELEKELSESTGNHFFFFFANLDPTIS